MKTISIVGVSGVGKSTYAQNIALNLIKNGDNSDLIPTDLIKDGFRFMLLNNVKIKSLNDQEKLCLLQPSKKLDIHTGALNAYTVTKIKNSLTDVLKYFSRNTIHIYEGFFIPNTSEEITLLTADENWLTEINTNRMLKRHNFANITEIKKYAKNSMNLQDWLVNELTNNNFKYTIIDTQDVLKTCKPELNHPIITLEPLLTEMFIKWKINDNITSAKKYFIEGMNHAYRRTTDLK